MPGIRLFGSHCSRRGFIRGVGAAAAAALPVAADASASPWTISEQRSESGRGGITLFLCGDVMTGRAIDQILPHPNTPELYEPFVRDARVYVELAERVNGPISRPAGPSYIWGDALAELRRIAPDLRVVNLETAVTANPEPWPRKGIHYRMHPKNVGCLTAAGIHCCVLANNHVLDWGRFGLEETLATLHAAGIATAGAGRDSEQAEAPAVLSVPGGGRVLVFAFGHGSSGIPADWAAGQGISGVNRLADLSERTAAQVAERIQSEKKPGDLVVASIHWGGNWGYGIPAEQRRFAHRLIDLGCVDVLHGHSSHHVKAVEVYRDRLILFGCGDFLNDYEGITGHEEYRGDLALMYFPTLDPVTGRLQRLVMTPTRTERFRVTRAGNRDASWLRDALDREGGRFGTSATIRADDRLILRWRSG
jgi:poly-gamma-glutamate synthesis protein (capsule biosynthesis protein)